LGVIALCLVRRAPKSRLFSGAAGCETATAGAARGGKLLRGELGEEPRPVEAGPRIGLAAGGDVAVRGDGAQRQRRAQRGDQRNKRAVLPRIEWRVVAAFELDADREVVAARAAAPARFACVPGAPVDRHELREFAVAANQEVGGDAQR